MYQYLSKGWVTFSMYFYFNWSNATAYSITEEFSAFPFHFKHIYSSRRKPLKHLERNQVIMKSIFFLFIWLKSDLKLVEWVLNAFTASGISLQLLAVFAFPLLVFKWMQMNQRNNTHKLEKYLFLMVCWHKSHPFELWKV